MRHDPAGASIVIMLRSLKLYGMAQAVEDLVAQGAPAFEAAIPILSQLLKAEMAEREVRSIAYHMKVARFPAYKDLAGFSFASSDINEATVRQLHRGEFMENAENVVLIGGPGTGKSHVATAIGVQAIEHHRRKVRFLRRTLEVQHHVTELQIFEDGALIASHPVIEGKHQRRVDPSHRKAPPIRAAKSPAPIGVGRRPLDFYGAVGRRLATGAVS